MDTVKVRNLHRGDVVLVRGRPVVLREDPFTHGRIMAFRYRSADVIVGLMTAPADHLLDVVRVTAPALIGAGN